MADAISIVKAILENMTMSENLADEVAWTSGVDQSASGKEHAKAMADGLMAIWEEGKPTFTDWTAKDANTVMFTVKTKHCGSASVECSLTGDGKIARWVFTETSQVLPPLPDPDSGNVDPEEDERVFVPVAYYAALRGLQPPERLLRRVEPVIEAGARCSWNDVLERRHFWVSSVLAEAERAQPARRLIILHGDFEVRSAQGSACVWNSPGGARWVGGANFDLGKTWTWDEGEEPQGRGLIYSLSKTERRGQKVLTDVVWLSVCFLPLESVLGVVGAFFDLLPVGSTLHMHVLSEVPELCESDVWRAAGLPSVQWTRSLKVGEIFGKTTAGITAGFTVERLTEEGFVSLRREKTVRNFTLGGAGKGAGKTAGSATPSTGGGDGDAAAASGVGKAAKKGGAAPPPPAPKGKGAPPQVAVAAGKAAPTRAGGSEESFWIEGSEGSGSPGRTLIFKKTGGGGGGAAAAGAAVELPLLPFARHLTEAGRQDLVPVAHAVLNLGRLRALRYECEQFNRMKEEKADGQRFLEMCSSCGVKVQERPVAIPGLGALIAALEAEIQDLHEQREAIAQGRVSFDALGEIYQPGVQVQTMLSGFGTVVGLRVLQSWYQLQNTLFGPAKSFHLELEYLASMGEGVCARVTFTDVMSQYAQTRSVFSDLVYPPFASELEARLAARGRKYLQVGEEMPFVEYARGAFFPKAQGPAAHALHSGGRIYIDAKRALEYGHTAARGCENACNALENTVRVYKQQRKLGTESVRVVQRVAPSDAWMTWPALVGFSFTSKCWGQVLVEETSPVRFRENAFDQLVLPNRKKELIRATVRHAGALGGTDLVSGKGGSAIFLLHGPPGCGKTLTAEAIAEMLKMPLYVVTAGDLGITAAEVEQRLSEVLRLCAEWNALTLIDEADIFLETRTTSELQRNAVVCVMLRLLEYHQGVLFLTTNRASNVDPAVRSRITVALRYPALDAAGREAVWRTLLELGAGPGDESAGDSGLTRGDISILSQLPLNGRQIKSCLLLAATLAKERGDAKMTLPLLEEVAEAVGGFDLLEETDDGEGIDQI